MCKLSQNLLMMESRVMGNCHARFGTGENPKIISKDYLSSSFEMIASAMEAKRLGLCNKPMIIVPKHLTMQVGTDFVKLYPKAKVLVATDKDFETKKRKEFCARIATQNWDAVIMGHSQFQKIPLSSERLEKYLNEELQEAIDNYEELKANDADRFSVKQAEQYKKRLEKRLEEIQENNEKGKDHTLTFEQLGVDRLYVDEAHNYKNMTVQTQMTNVPGVKTDYVAKTADMSEKCRYLRELNPGKCGIVFATGTPIANSMAELYTMQKYLQPDRLKKEGLDAFDSWVANFGQVITSVELAPEGGFQLKTRFARFNNLPELMSMFKEIADIKMADQLNLNVPEAEKIICNTPPTAEQEAMVRNLGVRAEAIRSGHVDPKEDNLLNIVNEGRTLALDQRLIDPMLPDAPNSKVNTCVKNVLDICKETRETKSAQIIFCDQSTPDKDTFTVYDDIKQKLIAKGVPEEEIAFIHDAKDDKAKDALFAKVRKGEVRVLIGSTQKMGTGTNVQDKLIALHDLDIPWVRLEVA